MMNISSGMAIVSFLALIASDANATTCQQRANNCSRLGGGPSCYEASRMSSCAASKVYIAPSGRSWEANGGGAGKGKH